MLWAELLMAEIVSLMSSEDVIVAEAKPEEAWTPTFLMEKLDQDERIQSGLSHVWKFIFLVFFDLISFILISLYVFIVLLVYW